MYVTGAVIGQLPFTFLFPVFPMNYTIPSLELGWGIFTLLQYRSQSYAELMAYRFFVGIFEVSTAAMHQETVVYLLTMMAGCFLPGGSLCSGCLVSYVHPQVLSPNSVAREASFLFPLIQRRYAGCSSLSNKLALISNRYRGDELGRRGGVFYVGQMLGTLTAGFIQSGASANLDGVRGMAGWRSVILSCFGKGSQGDTGGCLSLVRS